MALASPLQTADLTMPSEPIRPDRPTHAPTPAAAARGASAVALPYEALFLASPLPASVSCLSDGRLLAVNEAWLVMTGRTREAVIGRTTLELGFWLRETDRQSFVDNLGTFEQERTLLLANGEHIQVRLHGVKIDAEPRPVLLAFAIEVTRERDAQQARERSELALREANRTLERRLELHAATERLASVGHWTNATDDERVYWSPGLYEITGLPAGQCCCCAQTREATCTQTIRPSGWRRAPPATGVRSIFAGCTLMASALVPNPHGPYRGGRQSADRLWCGARHHRRAFGNASV